MLILSARLSSEAAVDFLCCWLSEKVDGVSQALELDCCGSQRLSSLASLHPEPFRRQLDSSPPELYPHAFELRTVARSEEHTSELQSRQYLVCRLLLEKKTENKSRP